MNSLRARQRGTPAAARQSNAISTAADASAADHPTATRAIGGSIAQVAQASMHGEPLTAHALLAALGGWRGVVESLLPALVYLVTFTLSRDARLSTIGPFALLIVAISLRLLRRESLTAAFSGAFGVAVCVAAVLFTGEGSSYFVPGFFINGAWLLAHTISLLLGWPLIGLLLGVLRGSVTAWRKVTALRRAAQLVTIGWIVLFAARLAVQLPLFFAAPPYGTSQTATELLGVARLVMGVPLFALAVLFTWLVLARVSALVDRAAPPVTPEQTG